MRAAGGCGRRSGGRGGGCGRGHGLALHQPGVLPGPLLEPAGQVRPLRAAHHPQLLGHRGAGGGAAPTRRTPPAGQRPPARPGPPPAGHRRQTGRPQEEPCGGGHRRALRGRDPVPAGLQSLAPPEEGRLPLGQRQQRRRRRREGRGRPPARPGPHRLRPARWRGGTGGGGLRWHRAAPAALTGERRPHHLLQVTGTRLRALGDGRGGMPRARDAPPQRGAGIRTDGGCRLAGGLNLSPTEGVFAFGSAVLKSVAFSPRRGLGGSRGDAAGTGSTGGVGSAVPHPQRGGRRESWSRPRPVRTLRPHRAAPPVPPAFAPLKLVVCRLHGEPNYCPRGQSDTKM